MPGLTLGFLTMTQCGIWCSATVFLLIGTTAGFTCYIKLLPQLYLGNKFYSFSCKLAACCVGTAGPISYGLPIISRSVCSEHSPDRGGPTLQTGSRIHAAQDNVRLQPLAITFHKQFTFKTMYYKKFKNFVQF